jgi:hypothetical protein
MSCFQENMCFCCVKEKILRGNSWHTPETSNFIGHFRDFNQANATGPTPCYFFTQIYGFGDENSVAQKTQWLYNDHYPY